MACVVSLTSHRMPTDRKSSLTYGCVRCVVAPSPFLSQGEKRKSMKVLGLWLHAAASG